MTIHVHRVNGSVGYGSHRHSIPADTPDEDRTWSFSCTPECEERIMRDVEHVARNADTVPLTVEERAQAEVQERVAHADVANMASALASLAKSNAKTAKAKTAA